MKLERMGAFFDSRLDGYEEHMLTVQHEVEALRMAGFPNVEILKNWGATYALRARK